MIQYKNREVILTEPIEFYRCLNRKGFTFSIRQNGRVVAHTNKIILKDCQFMVNLGGKNNCIANRQRNVHAYIKAYIGETKDIKSEESDLLKYNPYSELLFNVMGSNITKAEVVYIQDRNIYCQL